MERGLARLGDEHGPDCYQLVGEGIDQGAVLVLQVFLDHLSAADALKDLQETQLGTDGGTLAEALPQDTG